MKQSVIASAVAASCLLASALPAAVSVDAPRCAASVEEAARGILTPATSGTEGAYRVHDLLIDPVLRKAWVRIADCRDARKPLALVPLAATVAGSTPATPGTTLAVLTKPVPVPPLTPEAQAPLPKPALIASGDPVDVIVESATVHMTLHGRATTAAAAGEALDVELPSQSDNPAPPRHLRGIAIAAHRVQVQP